MKMMKYPNVKNEINPTQSQHDVMAFSSAKISLGSPTPPPGGRAGSENDTLLPMTMTCDRLKFWNGLAWRSKVIIRKPWRGMHNYVRRSCSGHGGGIIPAGRVVVMVVELSQQVL